MKLIIALEALLLSVTGRAAETSRLRMRFPLRVAARAGVKHQVSQLKHCQVPNKIFISYRRQDSSANAISISQYLEKAFGQKNVFIDVDMHAGA